MRSDKDVYGIGVKVTPIPIEVCEERIEMLSDRLKRLLKPHYMKQDEYAINQTYKDINFWKEFKAKESYFCRKHQCMEKNC